MHTGSGHQRRGLADAFALWIGLAAVAGYLWPAGFEWVLKRIAPLLGVIMLGMGMTLRGADFARVLREPRGVLIGIAAQYLVMPFTGLLLARLMGLPPELAVGVVLLGACPGGTASNVMTYLARGDVALSVTMTAVSSLLAPVLTPLLTLWLAGRWMAVPAGGLFLSVAQIVLVPVAVGLLLNTFASRQVQRVTRALPIVSVVVIALIVAAVVGHNADQIRASGAPVLVAVVLHNAAGLGLGYACAVLAGVNEAQRRAIAIEVGMQNSGLASALAVKHFSALAAVPGALFSVWHNVSGPILANAFRRRDRRAGA